MLDVVAPVHCSLLILLQHCDEFEDQSKDVPKHIESKYSNEMASKSETVSWYTSNTTYCCAVCITSSQCNECTS